MGSDAEIKKSQIISVMHLHRNAGIKSESRRVGGVEINGFECILSTSKKLQPHVIIPPSLRRADEDRPPATILDNFGETLIPQTVMTFRIPSGGETEMSCALDRFPQTRTTPGKANTVHLVSHCPREARLQKYVPRFGNPGKPSTSWNGNGNPIPAVVASAIPRSLHHHKPPTRAPPAPPRHCRERRRGG